MSIGHARQVCRLPAFGSFTQAVQEAFDARIYGGIHFRTACLHGKAAGTQIGDLVVATAARPSHGH